MKIKHWQGYGCLTATKVSCEKFTNPYGEETKRLVIDVIGNHECGIWTNDKYDVFNWLVKKFDKSAKSYTEIERMEVYYLADRNGQEVCRYTIVLNTGKKFW